MAPPVLKIIRTNQPSKPLMKNQYGDYKCGYSCLFALFTVLNLAFCLSSIAMVALGIYIWTQTKRAGEFEIGFIILGIIEFCISILGFFSKYSINKLNCYMWLLTFVFLAQLIASILGIALKDKIIDLAAEKTGNKKSAEEFKRLISDNVDVAFYATIAAVGVQLLCLILTISYRALLKKVDSGTLHARLLSEDKPKINLAKYIEDPMEKEIKEKKAKVQEKREELYNKYPEYQEYHNKKMQKEAEKGKNEKKGFFSKK